MQQAESSKDAILGIQNALQGPQQFQNEFREFLAALCAKKIPGINVFMPLVKLKDTYGVKSNDTVKLLGANYYMRTARV